MQAWGEFGFPMEIGIRKSKASHAQRVASLGRMRVRRAKRHTRVCANAGNPQAAQDRRNLFRTKFAPHSEGSINNIGLRA